MSGTLGGCLLDNPEESGNHLFVENRDSEAHLATITVREGGEDGEPVLQNRYRVPEGNALQFQGVLQVETAYYVTVEQWRTDELPETDEAQSDDLDVEVEPCEGDQENRVDVSVTLASSGPGIIAWPCDRSYVYREQLTYVEPEEHVVGTGTTTS